MQKQRCKIERPTLRSLSFVSHDILAPVKSVPNRHSNTGMFSTGIIWNAYNKWDCEGYISCILLFREKKKTNTNELRCVWSNITGPSFPLLLDYTTRTSFNRFFCTYKVLIHIHLAKCNIFYLKSKCASICRIFDYVYMLTLLSGKKIILFYYLFTNISSNSIWFVTVITCCHNHCFIYNFSRWSSTDSAHIITGIWLMG